MKILVVDDEPALLSELSLALERQSYSVDTSEDGISAVERASNAIYDLIILDIMLPKMSGLEVLDELRAREIKTPVLLLSALGEVSDRIAGLDMGADDYLVKPFSIDELFARIRSLLRRQGDQQHSIMKIREISLNTVTREVHRDSSLLDLTSREFAILEFLLYNRNRAVSRFSLAEHVWGDDFDPFSMSNFIDVHIKNLRKKLGDTSENRIIQTIRGIGYMIKG